MGVGQLLCHIWHIKRVGFAAIRAKRSRRRRRQLTTTTPTPTIVMHDSTAAAADDNEVAASNSSWSLNQTGETDHTLRMIYF